MQQMLSETHYLRHQRAGAWSKDHFGLKNHIASPLQRTEPLTFVTVCHAASRHVKASKRTYAMSTTPQPPDMHTVKARMKATWMAGDYGVFASHIQRGAEAYVARLALAPGMRVLDVACGSGNLAIPAARAGAVVTGTDISTNLLEAGRARAQAEGLVVEFDEGDAEHLP